MTYQEALMRTGAWSLPLEQDTPGQVKDMLLPARSGRGHVVITPVWVDMHQLSDADALALSQFTGIYLKRDEASLTLSGMHVNGWLGDGQRGRSVGYQSYTRTFTQWATAVTPGFLGEGIRSTIAGNFKLAYDPTFYRDLADKIAARYNAAWRVTNDFKLDFGTYNALFRADPVAMIVRHAQDAGRDMDVRGITGDLHMVRDIEDWVRTVVYWWNNGGTPASILYTGGVADVDCPFRSPDGSPAWVDSIVMSSTDNSTDANALAAAEFGKITGVRNELELSSSEYDIGRDLQVGDMVNVFDMDRGIYDMSNPVTYRGQTIYPQKIRAVGITQPIREGMGVWFRRHKRVDSSWVVEWTDLTPYVRWESGDATVEVGALPRTTLRGTR